MNYGWGWGRPGYGTRVAFGAEPSPAPAVLRPVPPGFVPAAQRVPQGVPVGNVFRPGARWLQNLQIRRQAGIARDQAIAQARAQGLTDSVRCSTFAAFHCSLYDVTTDARGASSWSIIGHVPGGSSLLTSLAQRRQIFLPALELVTVYPVLWPDGPNGPVQGWMPDGSFGT